MAKLHTITSLKTELAKVRRENKSLKEQLSNQKRDKNYRQKGPIIGLPQGKGKEIFTRETVARRIPVELWEDFKQRIEDWRAQKIYEYYNNKGKELAKQ